MEIAPFPGLRYALERIGARAEDVTAPPYDVIRPAEHQALLDRSPYNITRLTLGMHPGETGEYAERGELFRRWIESGVLRRDAASFYVYEVEYAVPGGGPRRRMLGLTALGRLHPFEDRIVLPHEETFPKVVDDRERLLDATGANLESIFLLYADQERRIDALLEEAARGDPVVRVEAKPGEMHAIHAIRDRDAERAITALMRSERPMIADGHHRYTTSLRVSRRADARARWKGAGWQMMTWTNLHGDGLAILATHRLVKLATGEAQDVVERLGAFLEPSRDDDWEIGVETAQERLRFRIPEAIKAAKHGVARTAYGFLHDVILGEWLRPWVGSDPEIAYYKESTGEEEALREGRGDILFRMRPVDRREFESVVQGGEVFPHKTTYFYPKLWSGLILWELDAAPGS